LVNFNFLIILIKYLIETVSPSISNYHLGLIITTKLFFQCVIILGVLQINSVSLSLINFRKFIIGDEKRVLYNSKRGKSWVIDIDREIQYSRKKVLMW